MPKMTNSIKHVEGELKSHTHTRNFHHFIFGFILLNSFNFNFI